MFEGENENSIGLKYKIRLKHWKINMSLSKLNIPSLRTLLHDAGFRGSVRAMNALGAIENRDILCAALFCSQTAPHEVFVNTEIACDHQHLTVDVMKLVAADEDGEMDNGWTIKPNGDAFTGITTRDGVARAGIPRSRWAASPKRATS